MNACKECGTRFLHETDKFCHHCGASVKNVIKEKKTEIECLAKTIIEIKKKKEALTYQERK